MAAPIAEPPHLPADLKTLCLSTIAAQWRPLAEQATRQRQAPADYLAQLAHLEVTGRRERRIQRRMQEARFPMLKTLDAFSFDAQPDLGRDAVLQIFGCGFVSIDINGEFQVCHNPRTMTHTVQQQPEALARLRLLVSVLGGAPHANWWRTEFLTVAGLRFLDRLYPRTSCAAALRATGVAATELHDSNIGRGRVYHLFRLPEPLKGQLDALAGNGFFDQVFGDLKPILEAREALLAQFDDFAPELRPTDPGPQRIGHLRDLQRGHLIGKWAGAYLHAFQKEHRVFPYVEAERTV